MSVYLESRIPVVPCDPAVCCLLALVRSGEGGQRNVAYVLFLSALAAAYIPTAVHQRLTTCFFVCACVCLFSCPLWIVACMDFFLAAFPLVPLSCGFSMSLNWPLKDNDLSPVIASEWKRLEHSSSIHLCTNEQPLVEICHLFDIVLPL